jgi:uncharacterized membrane protein
MYVDDRLAGSQRVTLAPGENTFTFALKAPPAGFHTFRAVLLPDIGEDTIAANNEASAFAQVQGPPHLLVVENAPGAAHNVTAALRAQGLTVDEMPATRVPPDMSFLQRYAAVMIVDTPADLLGADFMALLPSYVRDLGHGLAVIGGSNSYAMGGYGQTPLEQVLPVRMDVPQRKDTPVAAVALIIEDLESDYGVNISKIAGKGVVKLLTPTDWIAVNDASTQWVVGLRHVTDKNAIDQTIDAMQPIDPATYADALTLAYNTLLPAKAAIKHIILLGDGDATDNYRPLVQKIAAHGISVSTVATGALGWSDFATMQNIAKWGKGRYYSANSVNSIPQIFLKEAKRIARTGIVEERFIPYAASTSPLLNGLNGFPELDGYVATTPKPAAENVLISARADPVLAAWQYGLGRSVAWTSDSAGQWTSHLLAWPAAARLWGNIASWILPPAANKNITLSATANGGTGQLTVDTTGPAAALAVQAHIVGPSLSASTVSLLPTAPGHYEATFDAAHPGAYLVRVEVTPQGGPQAHGQKAPPLAASGGLVVPYSPEFRLTGVDQALVAGLAATTGGRVLPAADSAGSQAFADNLPPVPAPRPLSSLLLLLAALLLPVDVAVRRLLVTRADALALLAALRPRRAATQPSTTTAGAPLLRVREQRARARTSPPSPQETPRGAQPAPKPAVPPEGPVVARAGVATEEPRGEARVGAEPQLDGAPTPNFSSQLLDAKRRRRR